MANTKVIEVLWPPNVSFSLVKMNFFVTHLGPFE